MTDKMWVFLCNQQVPYSLTNVTAARTLRTYETFVEITSTGAYTITLPKVAEARGNTYNFRAATLAGNVTLNSTDALNWTNIIFDTAGDKARIYSDGRTWHVLTAGTV